MDRTLLRKDSASLYMRYQRKSGHASARDVAKVAWWILQYTFGVVDARKVAAKVVRAYEGRSEESMRAWCETWFEDHVRQYVTEAGRRAHDRHKKAGDIVAIVTGATPYIAGPVARDLGVDHIVCTELEVSDGRFTGKFVDPMCYGDGKIELSERIASELGFDLGDSIFYTDSITDLPLLEAVADRVVVNPDPRLRRLAKKRGWPIETW